MDIVNDYIKDVLSPQLSAFGIPIESKLKITENIKNQMYSLLFHWNEMEFRNTALFIGLEEGTFYQPRAHSDVKTFVVVTIRNSILEIAASVDFAKLKNEAAHI